MNRRKILELSVLVLLALVFMAWLAGLLHFGKISPGLAPLTGAAPPGQVVVVTETPIPRRLEIPGQVISPSLAQISSQVPGKVTKTWVEAGSRVKQGDALITLFAREYQERLNQARAGWLRPGQVWPRSPRIISDIVSCSRKERPAPRSSKPWRRASRAPGRP